MPRPEGFQLPFDFPSRSGRSLVTYEYGIASLKQPDNTNRFLRRLNEEVQIISPADAAHHLMANVYSPFDALDQEEVWVCLLNTKNRITHEAMVYRGTINTAYIRIAELFKDAVRVNAPAILLSHPHPSGDPSPSHADVQVTEDAVAAGKLLEIEVLDHLIIGRDVWVSLKERNLGFGNAGASGMTMT